MDIQKQLSKSRLVICPLQLLRYYIASPLGLVPKYNGGYRRIYDLSYLEGKLVNNFIPRQYSLLKYTTFDDALKAIILLGPNCFLVKKDLLDTFYYILITINNQ